MEHDQQGKLLQLFMGLNESYGGVRSQILLMNPLSSAILKTLNRESDLEPSTNLAGPEDRECNRDW